MSIRGTHFLKMHGLGNDFIVIDARTRPLDLTPERVRALADRHSGVGCDQFVTIEPARGGGVAFMGLRNADGEIVESCGNASRCVGRLLLEEREAESVLIETLGGMVEARRASGELIEVDMGPARLTWQEIPLAGAADTLHIELSVGPLSDPCAVSMGNPHAVFFVDDADAIDLATWGPLIEHHGLFPNRTNVEAVHLRADGRLRMRVWERGVGITRACGTGACASAVAAMRRGLIAGRTAEVVLDGGTLGIVWRESDGHVLMTGSATLAYSGVLDEGAWA
ncbi:diaminopimelate epimerase [Rhodospirillum rubrum]|uniref:Diaminopimelate epimerase n=1 Tax=Rhodospirillum rubrum (strain ATCC 11170 / ATH 1.1.1 / DSM 467 / LMG 4362 / NCIMB 8255 / S1) TaxID=269796 RepID=Q2RV61_RHORT|nr:diaminopimelate epimerase [Rhodospirillum rubrum]ABC21984.1 diaminopimelate epimerase [Rhodospirillum rubrum ATCC 11170]MBK5953565.1 diaminopimelate epimerase [Rhodospirillum rubrum]QXG81640.1 diaminopimelate epimerase [Rhodospirillum rubrum]HAP99139.1 diaminopimelate epimerase [Rhodospirillum rubrum]HCF18288.1 diaminopimelate epimerase [Rhodospirillum rubrum]